MFKAFSDVRGKMEINCRILDREIDEEEQLKRDAENSKNDL